MKIQLHHVALTVYDLNESVEWYRNVFGFQVANEYKDKDMEIVLLHQDEVKIELFVFSKRTKDLPKYREDLINDLHVVGTKHLCLEVEDLNKTIKELKQKSVNFVTKVDSASFDGSYVFIKDCNGILIELYQKETN